MENNIIISHCKLFKPLIWKSNLSKVKFRVVWGGIFYLKCVLIEFVIPNPEPVTSNFKCVFHPYGEKVNLYSFLIIIIIIILSTLIFLFKIAFYLLKTLAPKHEEKVKFCFRQLYHLNFLASKFTYSYTNSFIWFFLTAWMLIFIHIYLDSDLVWWIRLILI